MVDSQDDTLWFGELDFTAELAAQGETAPRLTLLLFGGPKPGGIAMKNHVKLGLDAFCQKVLVKENPDGSVSIAFNGIAAMAMLHHGDAIKPHQMLDKRIGTTLSSAIQ